MIEVNKFIFWAICSMAAIGVLQSVLMLFKPEQERDWRVPQEPAPEGWRWKLVKDE